MYSWGSHCPPSLPACLGTEWTGTGPGQSFQSGFSFQIFQVFVVSLVTNHYCYLMLTAVHIQNLHMDRKCSRVTEWQCVTTTKYSSSSGRWHLAIREQCRGTAQSPHYLSVPCFASISSFSKYFPPQIYSSFCSLLVCNVPMHFVAIYTCVRYVANNAEGKDPLVQEVPLCIQQ